MQYINLLFTYIYISSLSIYIVALDYTIEYNIHVLDKSDLLSKLQHSNITQ